MTKQVILEGRLGDKYGSEWNIKAKTVKDVFECIAANYPSFKQDLYDGIQEDVCYTLQHGSEFIGEEELDSVLADTLIITELPAGAKGGTGKIVSGIALIAAYFFAHMIPVIGPYIANAMKVASKGKELSLAQSAALAARNAVGLLGVNLTLMGIQQLNAPDPSIDENDTTYLFNGPSQTVISGQPIPYLFGRKIVGGIPITSDIVPGNIPARSGVYEDPIFGDFYPNYNYDGSGTVTTPTVTVATTVDNLIGE